MKRILIGLICLGFVGGGAFLVSHLQSPVTDVTVVTIHAMVDPAIARGQIWVGEENSFERTIEIEVRGRSLRLPDNFQIWNETYETIARTIPPHAQLTENASSAIAKPTDLLVSYGEHPIRGIRGDATHNGTTSSWLWLVIGDPDGVRVSGVALRATEGEDPLIPRDVILPVELPRKQSTFELLLTRERITEQKVEVLFTRPQ